MSESMYHMMCDSTKMWLIHIYILAYFPHVCKSIPYVFKENIKWILLFFVQNNTFYKQNAYLISIWKIFIKNRSQVVPLPMLLQWCAVLKADTKMQWHQILLTTISQIRLQKKTNHVNTTGNKAPFLHHHNWDPPLEELPCKDVHYM